MRVGVVLGDFQPRVGGGYTFVAALLSALLRQAAESPHEYIVLGSVDPFANQSLPGNVRFAHVPRMGFLAKANVALKHYAPVFGLLSRFLPSSSLEKTVRQEKIEMVWFVGGGVYDTLDTPYIATVWDLQHRTHPWFPEVSSDGRWDYRELLHSRFLKRASVVVTGTEVGKQQLRDFYSVPGDRVRILPHPTPSLARPTAQTPLSDKVAKLSGKTFVFYPAQFWAHKNHVNLLLALRELKEKHGVELHLALTGSDKGNEGFVRKRAAELGLAGSVHFLGFVSLDELSWLYTNAKALVYPSFSGPENLPPLEALSLECPVLISDYPGAQEQLGDAAIYFTPESPTSIAETILKFLRDPQFKEQSLQKAKAQLASRTSEAFLQGIATTLSDFESTRRCWE